MTGQEIATAFHHGVAPIVLVFNNQMYGTIRMHQERAYPGRVSGTALTNPDFAKFIEAFGGHGEVVSETAEFAPAFRRAVDSGRPAVIELRMNPEQITTRATIAELRAGKPAPSRCESEAGDSVAASEAGAQCGKEARLEELAAPTITGKAVTSMSYGFSHQFQIDAAGKRTPPSPSSGMEAAVRYYRAGDYAEVERCCLELIAHDALHFDALHLLGVVCLDQARFSDSVSYLTRADSRAPGRSADTVQSGSALLGLKQYRQAEPHLRRAAGVASARSRGAQQPRQRAGRHGTP